MPKEEGTHEQGLSSIIEKSVEEFPCLTVLTGESAGKTFRLEEKITTLGRSKDCKIAVRDEGVSRFHAEIHFTEKGFVLIDKGSTNGTFLNGKRISDFPLNNNDRIALGANISLKFTYQDEAQEAMQRTLYESAIKDELTSIYNRRYLNERLAKDFAYFRRHNHPFSLMLFDIDRFKKFNDQYGHVVGDHVLRDISSLVAPEVRKEDLFARFGGEEFAVILTQCDCNNAWNFAERIRKKIEETPFDAKGEKVEVTISIGISTLQGKNFSSDKEMLESADEFLYLAKTRGRNRCESVLTSAG